MAEMLNSSKNGREQAFGIEVEAPHATSDSNPSPKSLWRRFSNKWLRMDKLVWWTMLGVVCGIALGGGLYTIGPSDRAVELIGYPGELLLHALQELILPLMTFAIMSGVFSLRHTQTGSGKIARWSVLYYIISMVLAIAVGIMMVFTIKPGRSRPFGDSGQVGECSRKNQNLVNSTASSSSTAKDTVDSLLDIGRQLIPTNIVAAAAAPNYLGVMLFAIVFAFCLTSLGVKAEPLIELIEVVNDTIIKIIHAIIVTTPVGIASLIAGTILSACNLGHLLRALAEYVGTIVGAFAIHVFLVLPITLLVMSRRNPVTVFRHFLPAFAMGFGTSSSAATMPVTMQCAEDYGCLKHIVKFVVPLGTNVNRDGTALYEAVSVIFIAQAHGRALSAGNVIVISLTACLAAIGSASIPHAGLVTLITVMQAVGFQEYIGDLSILLAVDWLLSMLRTIVNIWGDSCACVVVDAWAKSAGGNQDPSSMETIADQGFSKLEPEKLASELEHP